MAVVVILSYVWMGFMVAGIYSAIYDHKIQDKSSALVRLLSFLAWPVTVIVLVSLAFVEAAKWWARLPDKKDNK